MFLCRIRDCYIDSLARSFYAPCPVDKQKDKNKKRDKYKEDVRQHVKQPPQRLAAAGVQYGVYSKPYCYAVGQA
jgi:hypothetical protein